MEYYYCGFSHYYNHFYELGADGTCVFVNHDHTNFLSMYS